MFYFYRGHTAAKHNKIAGCVLQCLATLVNVCRDIYSVLHDPKILGVAQPQQTSLNQQKYQKPEHNKCSPNAPGSQKKSTPHYKPPPPPIQTLELHVTN
jgi:hypothetical protein